MGARVQLWCAWAIVPFIVLYLTGFVGLAGFVPPHAPTISGAQLAEVYEGNRTGIRAGQLLGVVSSLLFLCWAGAVSVQMARIEQGSFPLLAMLQFGGALILVTFFMICGLIWSVAAYRADIDPELLRAFDDAGWLFFVMAYPEYLVQLGSIAAVGFMDKSPEPWLPRWACYFTVWVAIAGIGGGFATFVKAGPFAWNGLFGFWVPVICFLIWLVVMLPLLLREIGRQRTEKSTVPVLMSSSRPASRRSS